MRQKVGVGKQIWADQRRRGPPFIHCSCASPTRPDHLIRFSASHANDRDGSCVTSIACPCRKLKLRGLLSGYAWKPRKFKSKAATKTDSRSMAWSLCHGRQTTLFSEKSQKDSPDNFQAFAVKPGEREIRTYDFVGALFDNALTPRDDKPPAKFLVGCLFININTQATGRRKFMITGPQRGYNPMETFILDAGLHARARSNFFVAIAYSETCSSNLMTGCWPTIFRLASALPIAANSVSTSCLLVAASAARAF